MPCSNAIFASRDCSSSALPWPRRARRKGKSQAAGTAALQLPRRTQRLRRARPLPRMLRPLHILPRRTPRPHRMSPPRASPHRMPPPPRTSPRPATRPLHTSPHRARRRGLRHISPRRVPRRRKLPRRGMRSKRLAQRRNARRRVPQPGRAVRSPQPLPRMAAVTPGPGKTRRSQPQLHDNQTQPRDKA